MCRRGDPPRRRASGARSTDFPPLENRNVVVVQTKAQRLGVYLMGASAIQRGARPRAWREVGQADPICAEGDPALLRLVTPGLGDRQVRPENMHAADSRQAFSILTQLRARLLDKPRA